ncbi:uncharacterized protein [Hetaerina americana]|uniref:uncharacterized protein n=1 Tax=Hetaerina americana TaxID=62018 RepID=UPI003A7F53D8
MENSSAKLLIITNNDAAIGKSTCAAIGKSTDTIVDRSVDAAIDTKTDATIAIKNDVTIGTATDAAFRRSSGTAVGSNIDATINESAHVNFGTCDNAVANENTELSMDVPNAGTDISAIENSTGPVNNSPPDVVPNSNDNSAIDGSAMYAKEKGELNVLECKLSESFKDILPSGDTAQPYNTKNSQHDSEIEIIDCSSESFEDQTARQSPATYNPNPELSNDSSNAVVDTNLDAVVNLSTDDTFNKTSRLTKKQLYERRCRNMRVNKMMKKSGDTDQPSKSKNKISHRLEKLTQNNMKFMENFDPKRSNRERRKLLRKTHARRNRIDIYGLDGALVSCGINLCDCMDFCCPGCHFPCPRCHSPKCGHECRVNRKGTYDDIEIYGTNIVIKPDELIQGLCNKSENIRKQIA